MVKERTEGNVSDRPCDEILSDPNRGKLAIHFGSVARRPLRFLRVLGPFLTAHHPLCSEFEGHIITIRGRKFCIGCLFNSISFFGGFPILFAIWYLNPLLLTNQILLWSGVAGVVISLLNSILGFNENMKVKVVSKLLLGAGFAAICLGILVFGGDIFYRIDLKIFAIFILYLPVMTLMNGKRMWDIEKECADCDFKMRWSKCPGFRDIVCEGVEEGFIRPNEKPNE
ncbi:MAG: hypothetical protein ACW98Y_06180 [Candidatus Thorarchaeota archaeon]